MKFNRSQINEMIKIEEFGGVGLFARHVLIKNKRIYLKCLSQIRVS